MRRGTKRHLNRMKLVILPNHFHSTAIFDNGVGATRWDARDFTGGCHNNRDGQDGNRFRGDAIEGDA